VTSPAIKEVEDIAEKLFSDPVIAECDPQVFSGAVEALKAKATNDWGKVFDKAVSGDRDADWALRMEAAEILLATGHPLFIYVAGILQESLVDRPPPGKGNPYKNAKRDQFIWRAVERLVEAGHKPTRNEAHRNDDDAPASACSIVTRILKRHGFDIAESTVETVWSKRVLNESDFRSV
jgi:hypothetical protein